MAKIVRKIAGAFTTRDDMDCRKARGPLFVSVVESERAQIENIGRAWRLRR